MTDILFPTPIETYIRFQKFLDLVESSDQASLAEFLRDTELAGISQKIAEEIYSETANIWGVEISDCVIVGSARLGFSPVEKRDNKTGTTQPAGRGFSAASDIDIAIISSDLFDELWQELFRFAPHYRPWNHAEDCRKYLYRGWLRPDKMPFDFSGRIQWFERCNEISKAILDSLLKVTVAIYKNREFFESSMLVSAYGIRSRLTR